MKTHTTKQKIWLRSLVLLPLLALTLYGFSEKKEVVREIQLQNTIQNEEIKNQGATDEMMKEYRAYISSLNQKHLIIQQDQHNRIVAIYDLMTQEQKNSVEPYPKSPSINLSQIKANKPTQEQFSSWKNSKEFALWIDGKHVKNSELNNYSIEDIHHFNGSFVYKNARSTNFPQPYQFQLYTKSGFEETFKKSNLNTYNQLFKTYSEAINEFLNSTRENNSELKIKKAQLDRIYNEFSKEDKTKYNIPAVPLVPTENSHNLNDKSQTNLSAKIENNIQQKATPEEVAEYNKLAKQINSQDPNQTIIRQKDVDRLKYLQGRMNKQQKANAEPFPNFPPPPPSPPTPPNPESKTIQTTTPPPPPPVSTLDHIEEMKKKGALFFFNDKEISADEAMIYVNKNKQYTICTNEIVNQQPTVTITTEPANPKNNKQSKELVMVNGIKPINDVLSMSRAELIDAKLSINGGEIISFKLKIPGKPTQSIKGNVIDAETKEMIKEAYDKDAIQLFMIKNSDNIEHSPIMVFIKEAKADLTQSDDFKQYLLERDKTFKLLKNPAQYPGSFLEMSDGDQSIFQEQYMKMHRTFSKLTELEKNSAPKMLSPAPDPKMYTLKNGKIVKKNQ